MEPDKVCNGTASALPRHGGFFELFDPFSRESFLNGRWNNAPRLARGRGKELARLIDLDLLDAVIGDQLLRKGEIQLRRHGLAHPEHEWLVDGAADKHSVLDAIASGCALDLRRVGQHQPVLAELLRDWETTLHMELRASAHLEPAGLGQHDEAARDHDVVIVQTHGSRTWTVTGLGSISLGVGDTLYVPRSHAHARLASDAETLHLEIELIGPELGEVLHEALTTLLVSIPAFRYGHVPGHSSLDGIRGAMSAALSESDLASMIRAARGRSPRSGDANHAR